jgi:hypothetical protein
MFPKFSRSLNRGMWYGLKDLGVLYLGWIKIVQSCGRRILGGQRCEFLLCAEGMPGLIGRNGAGKSTLKMLMDWSVRTKGPSRWEVKQERRSNWAPDLIHFYPGVNVYVNGQLLDLVKEIDQKSKSHHWLCGNRWIHVIHRSRIIVQVKVPWDLQ